MASTGTDAEPDIVLYNHPLSSYTQKIRIALREKGVPFEVVLPGATPKSIPGSSLQSANPRLEVPTLIDRSTSSPSSSSSKNGGHVEIFDSTIILEYIEEKWPSPPLLPPASDPAARARARMIEEVCDTQYEAVNWGWGEVFWFQRADGALADELKRQVQGQTKVLQDWLAKRLGDQPFFGGPSFGWADLCVAPILNRSVYYGFGPDPASSLGKWIDRIRQRQSVRDTFAEFEEAAGKMHLMSGAFKSGELKREYRDHRLEWLIKSGGIDVVSEGIKNNNIKFSWPQALP